MKTQLEPRDLFDLVKVGDPQMSPDEKWMAFTHQRTNLKENKTRSSIWLVPMDGSQEPRRITPETSNSRMPRWAPVGGRLAFLSDRDHDDGKDQIYLIDVSEGGGEAHRVATDEVPGSAPVWSPDGQRLAFSAWIEAEGEDRLTYPGAPSERDEDDEDEDEQAQPDKPVVMTTLGSRIDGYGFFNGKTEHILTVDAEATGADQKAETRRITDGPYFHGSPAFSPDGRWIACMASRSEPHHDLAFDRRLWVFSADSEKAYPVLDSDYPVYAPSWSPDGKRISFYGQPRAFNWLSAPNELYVVDVVPGETATWEDVTCVSSGLDRNVGMAAGSETRAQGAPFTPPIWLDDRTLLATVASEGQSHVYRFDLGGEPPVQVTRAGRRTVSEPTVGSDLLGYAAAEPTKPDQIYVVSLREAGERALTDFNRDVADEWPMNQPEVLSYEGSDGWTIQGWFLRAWGSESGQSRPTILFVHGGPSGMFAEGFSFTNQLCASRGYHVLYVNPRGSSGYGTEFQWAVIGDWGGRDFGDIMAAVDLVSERGDVSEKGLGITGWSYGGFMTNWAITQTDRFTAAVSGASVSNQRSMFGTSDVGHDFVSFSLDALPFEDDGAMRRHSPIRHVERVDTPVLFIHGEGDLRCPIGQAEEMYVSLKKRDKMAFMVRYPGEPHGLKRPQNIRDRWERTLAWFDHHLKDDE